MKLQNNLIHQIIELLGVDPDTIISINNFLQNKKNRLYDTFIREKNGKIRHICAPNKRIKWLQKRVNFNILNKFCKESLSDCCTGFRPAFSIYDNALPHVGKDTVLNLDLKDFFPNIRTRQVYRVFLDITGNNDVSIFLTELCTYQGSLPQGAPTSPNIANLCARSLDKRLLGLAAKFGATYTRYADDITFSGKRRILKIIPTISHIIEDEGFFVNPQKIYYAYDGHKQLVTGLTVNPAFTQNGEVIKTPRITRKIKKLVRAVIHKWNTGDQPLWNGKEADHNTINGLLAYIAAVEPDYAKYLKTTWKERGSQIRKRKGLRHPDRDFWDRMHGHGHCTDDVDIHWYDDAFGS